MEKQKYWGFCLFVCLEKKKKGLHLERKHEQHTEKAGRVLLRIATYSYIGEAHMFRNMVSPNLYVQVQSHSLWKTCNGSV